ncbi:MAG: hypothetical protein JO235_24780 [Chroococcidiopsidaceae cyanobacterium CP_BM_RX_35]|nr:hypothetical protein [Chroococcidiopsidaceae cyanobacterium CP_BM_RX_35]
MHTTNHANLLHFQTYTLNAARKQGMTEQTTVTALADGAKNCWSVIMSLAPHCQQLLCILDWFHIAMRFQQLHRQYSAAAADTWEGIKWTLWHGKPKEALSKLKLLMTQVTETKKRSKFQKLYDYLKSNEAYLVNYEEREQQHKTYTSQVAESHIDSIINERYKKSKKMQWTRDGAHNVLQIRGMIISNEWGENWQAPVMSALVEAA